MATGFLLSVILLISGQSGSETAADEASLLAPRPACTAENHLKMWPPLANASPADAHALARSGRLEICTHGTWRYRWSSPTVHISQLAQKAKR